jgi:hypothetical protein
MVRAGLRLAHRRVRVNIFDRLTRRLVAPSLRRWWRRRERVDLGDLRRSEPVSRLFGAERGLPIDRHFIEQFLCEHASLIHGRALEVADRSYTTRFGGDRVTTSDVLHATSGNASATIVGNLETGAGIPLGAFDAVILTQVLMCTFDLPAVVRTIHGMLAPGGSALITVPSISAISRYDADRWGDYWRFTEQSAARLFEREFGAANVHVQSFGNALVAHAFLAGMATEELREHELAAHDRDYPIVVAVVATRR